jgi:hypothetical protein
MTDATEFVVHRDPVWRTVRNFIIGVELPERIGRGGSSRSSLVSCTRPASSWSG